MTTTEKNIIVAEFLNPNDKHNNFYFPQFKEPYIYQGNLNGYSEVFGVEELKFHSDWNWLMEVVEKIESLSKENETYSFSITKISVRVLYKGNRIVDLPIDNTKIQAVYIACVEFIKWYNEQKKD